MPIRKSRKKISKRLTVRMSADNQANLYSEFKHLGFESVFDVLPLSKSNFIYLYDEKLKGRAEQVYDWAMYYVNYISHAYREGDDSNRKQNLLSAPSDTTYTVDQGQATDLDILKPTNYKNLFPEDKRIFVCHPDSIKAQTSPMAYLVGLYQFVRALGVRKENEPLAEPIKKLFEERRPDLESLCLSEKNATKAIPGLDLVNNILSEAIKKQLATEMSADQSLDELLAYGVYPFELPFYLPYVQILKTLQEKKLTLATISQQVDKDYPYWINFKSSTLVSTLDRVYIHNYLSPAQRVVLIGEAIPHPSEVNNDEYELLFSSYLIEYYGLYHENRFLHHDNDASIVSRAEVERKLSEQIGKFENFGHNRELLAKRGRGETLSMLENMQLKPVLDLKNRLEEIRKTNQEAEQRFKINDEIFNVGYLTDKLRSVPTFLKQAGLTRETLDQFFSRGRYAPRLSKYVKSNSIDGDIKPATPSTYGSSYINKEGVGDILTIEGEFGQEKMLGGETNGRFFERINRFIRFQQYTSAKSSELDWLISAFSKEKSIEQSVFAFGVFQDLQSRYTLNLEEFTAFIYQICPYSIGDELSQFDRLFNANSQDESSALVLDGSKFDIESDHLADQKTIQRLCMGLNIDRASFQNLAAAVPSRELTRSLKTMSWFYKIVRMARLFNLTVGGLLLLTQLITQETGLLKNKEEYDSPESCLLLLIMLDQLTVWMKSHQLIPTQLLFMVGDEKNSSSLVATPQAMNFFNALKQAVDGEAIEEKQAITFVSQVVVKVYQVVPTLATNLIQWSGKDFALSLMAEFKKITDKVSDQSSLQKEGHGFLETLAILERHVASVKLLNLSNTELQLLNDYPEYFVESSVVRTLAEKIEDKKGDHSIYHESISKLHSLDPDLASNLAQLIGKEFLAPVLGGETKQQTKQPVPLTLRLLYLLTRLKDWLALSSEPEENVLSYFRFAHALPLDDEGKKHCTELLAKSLNWDKEEVKFLFSQLANEDKVAKTMSDIDWICRVKALCMQTGLSAEQLLKLSTLTLQEDTSYHDYAQLADALQTVEPQAFSIN